MASEKHTEQERINTSDVRIPTEAAVSGLSRRKFTRNALLGGAVLLSLSNRSAWGASSNTLMCISTNVLVSFENGASALTDTQKEDIKNFYTVRDNYDGNDNVDRRSSYRTGDVTEIGTDTCFEYKPK